MIVVQSEQDAGEILPRDRADRCSSERDPEQTCLRFAAKSCVEQESCALMGCDKG